MFTPTSVCLSALSKRTKRVQVQLLKDFPRFHLYKGEVARVKPSLMVNYLHYGNGARYILSEDQVDQGLLEYSKKQAELRKASQPSASKVVSETTASTAATTAGIRADVKEEEPPAEKKKGFLDSDITVNDVKIPGLRI